MTARKQAGLTIPAPAPPLTFAGPWRIGRESHGPATMTRRLTSLLLFAVCAALGLATTFAPSPASAHNSLASSDPANGAELTEAPARIVWTFNKSVPLDTLTVFLTDTTGTRTEIKGSTLAPGNDKKVVTPLPGLGAGSVSVRWRLVSEDGHTVTGRVSLTITGTGGAGPSSTAPADTVDAPADSAAAAPATNPDDTPTTSASSVPQADEADDATTNSSVPGAVRWLLRYASYLAIMSVVGILLTKGFVWDGADSHPLLRKVVSVSLLATAGLAALQLLVVASDVAGEAPWASLGSLGAASGTDVGMSLVVRIMLALGMWVVLTRYAFRVAEVYWTGVSVLGLGLLATWAFAGHSRSMRWPQIGVLADVVHHGAAAAWLVGLAVVAGVVMSRSADTRVATTVRRFSKLAAWSVGAIAVTGAVQSLRLVGNPADLFDGTHGRSLTIKVVLFAVMLLLAAANRNRISRNLSPERFANEMPPLRRAVMGEVAIGIAVIAVTATMVASAPATSTAEERPVADEQQVLAPNP